MLFSTVNFPLLRVHNLTQFVKHLNRDSNNFCLFFFWHYELLENVCIIAPVLYFAISFNFCDNFLRLYICRLLLIKKKKMKTQLEFGDWTIFFPNLIITIISLNSVHFILINDFLYGFRLFLVSGTKNI